jgi:hypothetical protein
MHVCVHMCLSVASPYVCTLLVCMFLGTYACTRVYQARNWALGWSTDIWCGPLLSSYVSPILETVADGDK